MGLGLDKTYPPEHKNLSQEILEKNGLLLSEYPDGKDALPFQFAQRNRVVTGLSKAVIVIEAPEGSGALITSSLALQYNREVLAVPGNITPLNSYGPNKLISEGAKLITSTQDVLDALGWEIKSEAESQTLNLNSEEEKKLAFRTGPKVFPNWLNNQAWISILSLQT